MQQRQVRLNTLYQQAENAMAIGNWEQAGKLYAQVLELDHSYRDAPARLAQVQQKINQGPAKEPKAEVKPPVLPRAQEKPVVKRRFPWVPYWTWPLIGLAGAIVVVFLIVMIMGWVRATQGWTSLTSTSRAAALAILPEETPTVLTPTVTEKPATLTPVPSVAETGIVYPTLTPVQSITETLPFFPTLTASPTLAPGSALVSAKDGMVLVHVPAGEFLMGDNEGQNDTRPQHKVYLDAFWIDYIEVTNAMYARCVSAGVCIEPGKKSSQKRQNYYGNTAYAAYPVINVDWYQAQTYCQWAERRLPTEVEWEKAACGTDGRIYPWGNEFDPQKVNTVEGGIGDTTAVGSYPAGSSPYGALDMAGNVDEWVADWYGNTYYYDSPFWNPTGPEKGDLRVVRGGVVRLSGGQCVLLPPHGRPVLQE